MPRFVAICQNRNSEQFWWFADTRNERCPEPGCNCTPRYYTAALDAADIDFLKSMEPSPTLAKIIKRLEAEDG